MKNFKHLAIGYTDLLCPNLNERMPIQLEQGGLFLCQSGHADIVIDLKRFHIKAGDMVVAFPYTILQIINHSDDFNGNALTADINFFVSIQIHDKTSYYLYVKENPCISLLEKEQEKIISLHHMLICEAANTEHPLRREIDECLMKMTAYEVAAIYIKRKPIVQLPRSRNEKIFEQYIYSLFTNYHIQRALKFYASEQSITPRHLSSIVKKMSGMTAGEWIISCTIANIKSKLQDNSLSIKEISNTLNFPNPSFFSQYFKKHTGVSPKEFRKHRDRP